MSIPREFPDGDIARGGGPDSDCVGASTSRNTPRLTARVDGGLLMRRAVTVVAGLAVLGSLGGIVWGLVVPGVTGVVIAPGKAGELIADTSHNFDAIALFACISLVVGIVSTTIAWRVRALRGIAATIAVTLGSGIGAALGMWVGGLVADARLGGPAGVAVGQYFHSAPSLRVSGAVFDIGGTAFGLSWVVVVFAPIAALAALVITTFASRHADLGVPVTTGEVEAHHGSP